MVWPLHSHFLHISFISLISKDNPKLLLLLPMVEEDAVEPEEEVARAETDGSSSTSLFVKQLTLAASLFEKLTILVRELTDDASGLLRKK